MFDPKLAKKRTLSLAIATACGFIGPAVSAQGLEEVIVTAQKRQVSLQDAPVAVSAFSSDQIQAFNFFNSQDISAQTPNLYMAPSGGGNPLSPQVYIRGQGQNAINI